MESQPNGILADAGDKAGAPLLSRDLQRDPPDPLTHPKPATGGPVETQANTSEGSAKTRVGSPPSLCTLLSRSLQAKWLLYRWQLRECQQHFSTSAVHELRVATRRLLSEFVLVRSIGSSRGAQQAQRSLKRRLRRLGELRDAQVQIDFLKPRLDRFPEIRSLLKTLRRTERRLIRKAAADVRGFKTRKLEKQIREMTERLARYASRRSMEKHMAAAAYHATALAFAEVVRRRRAVVAASPATIHRTRVAFKRFRYMVESLAPAIGLSRRDLLKLARYQRKMGNIQDAEVLAQCVGRFVDQRASKAQVLQGFSRYVQGRQRRLLRIFLSSADQVYDFWPPQGKKLPAAAHSQIRNTRRALP